MLAETSIRSANTVDRTINNRRYNMFKFLKKSLNSARPCMMCDNSFKAANMFRPPLTFKKLQHLLYQIGVLCSKPCGITNTSSLNPPNYEMLNILKEYDIKCSVCRYTLLIASALTHDDEHFAVVVPRLIEKGLLCEDCLSIFVDKFNDITFRIIPIKRKIFG